MATVADSDAGDKPVPRVTLVKRTLLIKTSHALRGDALVQVVIMARSDRPLDDPYFATAAKKYARGRGKVVEWIVLDTGKDV